MISIIVPAYNEIKHLECTLMHLLEINDIEIIIAEDSSVDGTRELAETFVRKYPNVFLTSSNTRSGKGAAIKRGIAMSHGELIGFIDADMSTHPEELNKLIDVINGSADMAIGSRNLPSSNIIIKQPWYRVLLGRTYSLIVRTMFGIDIRDYQCGCKLFKRSIWNEITVNCNDFGFDTELIIKAYRAGYKIKEVPVRWQNDRSSKVNPFMDSIRMFKTLLKIKIYG